MFDSLSKKCVFSILFLVSSLPLMTIGIYAQVNSVPVTTVSAASYERTPVAPESLVSSFGTRLATTTASATDTDPNTPGIQLPTMLAGTSVRVNGRLALLLFVSPLQVNFQMPLDTEIGTAQVKVTSGDGTESNGTVQVSLISPAMFTGNADGRGVLAAEVVRVKADGSQSRETLMQLDSTTGKMNTKPIDLGPEGERVFLEIYLTGFRRAQDPNNDGNLQELVTVVLGGDAVPVLYAGRQPQYVGLDQINIEIPRNMGVTGKITLSVFAGEGYTSDRFSWKNLLTANPVELEIASRPGAMPPQLSNVSPALAGVGQTITITGSNFAMNPDDNLVRLGGIDAKTLTASSTQLAVLVPYGAISGLVSVKTVQGEARSATPINIKTSLSGVTETGFQPLRGVTVRILGTNLTATSNAEGVFLFPDVSPSAKVKLEVDPSTLPSSVSFPKIKLTAEVLSGRDNRIFYPLQLQQNTRITQSPNGDSITLDVPTDATLRTSSGVLLARTDLSVTKINTSDVGSYFSLPLPRELDLDGLVQIFPTDAMIAPGGKLTFQRSRGYDVSRYTFKLYRLEQNENSDKLGEFVEAGDLTVSTDNKQLTSMAGAITETGYYTFRAIPLSTAVPTPLIAAARGAFSDFGKLVQGAVIRSGNNYSIADSTGGFVITNVIFGFPSRLGISGLYLRPGGTIERFAGDANINAPYSVAPCCNYLLNAFPPIKEGDNRPPVFIPPLPLTVNEDQSSDVPLAIHERDANQTVQVEVTGASFASIVPGANGAAILRLAPGTKTAGTYNLTIKATDNSGATTTAFVTLKVIAPNAAPVVSVPGAQTVRVGQTLNFDVTFSDPDLGQTVTLIVSGIPQGASFLPNAPVNPTGGTFSWSPVSTQIGSHTVTFTASDNGFPSLSTTKTVMISVPAQEQEDKWLRVANGGLPVGKNIETLAAIGTRLFGSINGAGVFTSDDQGNTWKAVNNGLTTLEISSVHTVGTKLVAVNGTLLRTRDANPINVFLSDDNGASWRAITPNISFQTMRYLSVAEGDWYALGIDGKILRSADLGTTWTVIADSRPGITLDYFTVGNGTVYGTSGYVNEILNIWSGNQWKQLELFTPISSDLYALGVNGANAYVWSWSELRISKDQGQSWASYNTTPYKWSLYDRGNTGCFFGDNKIFLMPNSASVVIWVSTDGGTTFNFFDEGLLGGPNDIKRPSEDARKTKQLIVVGKLAYVTTDKGVYIRKLP